MTAQILDGKTTALKIKRSLKEQIAKLPSRPGLAVILAGENPASQIYVQNKQKAAAEIGIDCQIFRFSDTVSQSELLNLIEKLNNSTDINGIILQLPLPKHINEEILIEAVQPEKDVDGFHPYNIGLLQNGSSEGIIAATPKGILRLLQTTGVNLSGKNALVIGRSKIVGKPAAQLLLNQDCTVTIAHSKTINLAEKVKQADIVISACGIPEFVKGRWIKKGAIVIDVGINRLNGKLLGDVEFAEAVKYASFITPVPGGVGPMTVAMLLENTYEAYLKQSCHEITTAI